MRIDVVGRNIEITDPIRTYAENKVARLPRFFDGVQQITVSLSKRNNHASTDFDAELVLDVEKHDDFIAHGVDRDLYAAIDLAIEKGERQLRDFKEKLKQGKH